MWERRLARWIVLGVPWLLVAAVGGVFPWAEWTALAALVVASALHMYHRARAGKPALFSPVVLGGLIALLLVLLSAVPLPHALVGLLSPLSGAAQADLARTAGHAPGWVPLSLDAVSSLGVARRVALYVLVFVLAVPLGRKPDLLRKAARSVAGLGLAFVGVAGLNLLSGDGSILGLYRPQAPLYAGASALVNPNHAAALLGLTLPVTAGLFVTGSGLRSLVAWGGAALAQLALLLLTPSGNALVAPFFLALLFLFFAARRRLLLSRHGTSAASARAAVLLGLGALLGLVVIQSAFEPLQTTVLEAARFDKLATIRHALELVPRAAFTGFGPGAFLFGFGAYGPPFSVALTQPESLPVQALLDFGVPGALAVTALPLAGLVAVVRRAHVDLLRVGLAVALLGFVVHDLADFAVDLPATGAAFFLVFGLAVGAADTGTGRLALRRVRMRWMVALCGAVALAGVAGGWLGEQALPRRQLLQWKAEPGQAPPVPLTAVVGAGRFFPLDGRVWLRVGQHLRAGGRDDEGLRWLEYAARVMPQSANVQETLARALGPLDPSRHDALLAAIVQRFWNEEHARAQAPAADFVIDEILREPRLRDAPRALLGDAPAHVRRFLAALDGRPLDVRKHALLALVRDYPASLDVLLLLERPLRDPDLASLRAPWLATLFSEHSDAPETWRFLAEDARRDGNLAGALAHLDRARSLRASPDAAVELLTVEVCLGLGLADRAAAALATLDARGLGTAPQRELLRARLAVAQGRPEAALTLLTHLLVDQPGNRDAMALQARVMADTGRWNEAREVYEQLYRLTGKRGYRVRAERLERLLTPKDDRRPRP